MEIKEVTEEDFAYITTAIGELFKMHNSIDPIYGAVDNEELVSRIDVCDIKFVAVDAEGVQVGFIMGKYLEQSDRTYPFASLQNIWVEEEFRGEGVATELIEAFEREAKELGAVYVEISVDLRNEPALHLWDRAGYAPYQEKRKKEL